MLQNITVCTFIRNMVIEHDEAGQFLYNYVEPITSTGVFRTIEITGVGKRLIIRNARGRCVILGPPKGGSLMVCEIFDFAFTTDAMLVVVEDKPLELVWVAREGRE